MRIVVSLLSFPSSLSFVVSGSGCERALFLARGCGGRRGREERVNHYDVVTSIPQWTSVDLVVSPCLSRFSKLRMPKCC